MNSPSPPRNFSLDVDLPLYDPRGALSRRRVGSGSFSASPGSIRYPSQSPPSRDPSPSHSHQLRRSIQGHPSRLNIASSSGTSDSEAQEDSEQDGYSSPLLSRGNSLLDSLPKIPPKDIPEPRADTSEDVSHGHFRICLQDRLNLK